MTPSYRHPRSRAALFSLALCAAGAIAPGNSYALPVNAVDAFDAAVARGLPQTVALAASSDMTRGDQTSSGELAIESVLDVDLRFPDHLPGDAPESMYLATWQGAAAVVTRSGTHLDISVPRNDGMEVIGFSRDTDESHHVETGAAREGRQGPRPQASQPAMGMPWDVTRSAAAPRQRRDTTLPALIFWLFLHDDTLGMTRQHVHAGYVAWWLADMKKILPTRRLWVIYSQQVEGLTDMPYGHEASLRDWTRVVENYARREKLTRIRDKFEYKFMLVTNDEVAPGVSGLSWYGGDEAMASLQGRYTIVAHEFGHTLKASHDDAEVRWSSWWPCETNMKSVTSALRANCYRYSAANERRMRVHMAHEWMVPVRLYPPEIPRLIID
ncbi:MAG TPA: hypothetical protein VM621_17565 [Luteibacter sp.]|uniref:hypothetical protein n=1 Tax=Luteibacter sp. TaxID=1886636 RepID=UPI002BB85AEE|nr:hypothetical protein [Luteibacter sp.]HVI56852.1 hypothetical protein [Luteibacter sp.]